MYTLDELAVMFPSCNPLAMIGEVPTCKSSFSGGERYYTIWGSGDMVNGEIVASQITLGKYYFTILGDRLRVTFQYSGTTRYKEFVTSEDFSMVSILTDKIEMSKEDFESKIRFKKDDSFFIRKFKEKVLHILNDC